MSSPRVVCFSPPYLLAALSSDLKTFVIAASVRLATMKAVTQSSESRRAKMMSMAKESITPI